MQSHVKRTWRVCRTLFNARGGRAEPCKSHARGVHSDGFQSLKLWFAAFLLSLMIKIYDKIHGTFYRRHKVSMWHLRNTVGILCCRCIYMVSVAWQAVLLIWRNKKENDSKIMLNSPRNISADQNATIFLIRSAYMAAVTSRTHDALCNKALLRFYFCFISFAAWLLWLWFLHNEADN